MSLDARLTGIVMLAVSGQLGESAAVIAGHLLRFRLGELRAYPTWTLMSTKTMSCGGTATPSPSKFQNGSSPAAVFPLRAASAYQHAAVSAW